MICVCMIVKNEEKFLRGCLDSVKYVADEIVIVDTGSTDKTIEIAQEYKSKIFNFEWINDFSAARNFALSKVHSDWILYLDADERLTENSRKDIRRYADLKGSYGLKCLVKSYDSFSNTYNTIKYTRFFKNHPDLKFEGKVHEQIDPSLKANKFQIIDSSIEIIHLGYDIAKDGKISKAKRNLELLLVEYNKSKSSYYAFQLGQTYMILGDYDQSQKFFEIALKGKDFPEEYKAFCHGHIANYELKKHKIGNALIHIKQAMNIDKTQPYLNLIASKIFLRTNKIEEAFLALKRALEYNSFIIKNIRHSTLDIILKHEHIIYEGIYMSLTTKNVKNLEFFLGKLEDMQIRDIVHKETSNLLKKITKNETITSTDINTLAEVINKDNAELFIHSLNGYRAEGLRFKIVLALKDLLSYSTQFMNLYALTLSDVGFDDDALTILENLLELPDKEPTTAFYLISIYLKKGLFNKVKEQISFIRKEFGNIPEVIQRVGMIENRMIGMKL